MGTEWRERPLKDAKFGGKGHSGALDECFHVVRVCASTGGTTPGDRSRDCLLTLDKPYTPLLSSVDDRSLALPAPLLFFQDGKVCSDAFAVDFDCLAPVHVWFPPLPDKGTASFSYRTCCTPPKTCPTGSELCRSVCEENSLCAWLEFSQGRAAPPLPRPGTAGTRRAFAAY
jgi:hypothetical protein